MVRFSATLVSTTIRSLGVLLGCCSCFCSDHLCSCSFVLRFVQMLLLWQHVCHPFTCCSALPLSLLLLLWLFWCHLFTCYSAWLLLLLAIKMYECCCCCFAVVCSFAGWLVLLGCCWLQLLIAADVSAVLNWCQVVDNVVAVGCWLLAVGCVWLLAVGCW